MLDQTETSAKQFTGPPIADADGRPKCAAGNSENEGGHMSSRFGRIVRDASAHLPYRVILSHEDGDESERAFATMREAEAFVRRNTPRPQARSSLRDSDAPASEPALSSTPCHSSTS